MGDRKRRFWSDEEKRSICLQTLAPGVSVAHVARRYSMNANLLFKWLRDERFSPDVEGEPDAVFLPVEISDDVPVDVRALSSGPAVSIGRLHIELSGGHRVIAEGGFDPDALARLLKGWLS